MDGDATDVYLDGAPENITPELALRAERVLPDRQGGYLVPLATAAAVGAFLDAWRRNDPNGVWGWATEVGNTLVVSRSDGDDPADEFPRAGEDAAGAALYDLGGWAWVSGTVG